MTELEIGRYLLAAGMLVYLALGDSHRNTSAMICFATALIITYVR